MTLGERIRKAREKTGMTQDQFSLLVGVTKGAISQWESGKTAPRYKVLPAIASATNTSVSWLLGDAPDGFREQGDTDFTAAEGQADTVKAIPVYAQNEALPDDFFTRNNGAYKIPCPRQLTSVPGVYAVRVVGMAMSPRYENNETIIIDPQHSLEMNDYVAAAIRHAHGQAQIILGRLVRNDKAGLILKQLNPNVTLHFPEKDVVAIGFIAISSVIF